MVVNENSPEEINFRWPWFLAGRVSIGSHLADSLCSQRCFVVVVDEKDGLKENNVSHLLGQETFRFVSPADFSPLAQVDYGFILDSSYQDWLFKQEARRWLVFSPKRRANAFIKESPFRKI